MTRAGATLVRTRRYVAARAGTYPAPVLKEDSGTGPTTPATPPRAEPSPALNLSAATQPGDARTTALPLSALPAAVAPMPNIPAAAAPPLVAALPASPEADAPPTEPAGAAPSTGSPSRRIRLTLLGLIAGAVCGAFVGTLLLVLANPAQNVARLTDPVGLWQSIDDASVRLSALGVALGFAILGGIVGWSRRRSAS